MVEKTTLRQLRGLNDLVTDALDAGMTRTEEIHRTVANYPYAALKRIGPVASPVRVVEFVETTITGSVYWTLHLATRVSGAVVARVLERLDTHAS